MRTYQYVRAGNGFDAVINNIVMGTAVIWVPVVAVVIGFNILTSDSVDEAAAKKAKTIATGQAGYDACMVKYRKASGLSRLWTDSCWESDYGVGQYAPAKQLTPKEIAAYDAISTTAAQDKQAAATAPWSDLKCAALRQQARDDLRYATNGNIVSADRFEVKQQLLKDHSCKSLRAEAIQNKNREIAHEAAWQAKVAVNDKAREEKYAAKRALLEEKYPHLRGATPQVSVYEEKYPHLRGATPQVSVYEEKLKAARGF